MKRKALISGNKVADIIIANDAFKAPPGFKIVETNEANIGDHYDAGQFKKPKYKAERNELVRAAHSQRQLASISGISFVLDNGSEVTVPTDYKTRRDISEIASLGIASKFVFPEGPFELTANDFSEIVTKIAEHTAENYAALAEVLESIEKNQLIAHEQIEKPERLNLKKWRLK